MNKYTNYIQSGVPWIGDMPEHWGLKKGKFVTRLLSGYPFNSDLFSKDDSDMPLIRIRDISSASTESFYSGKYPEHYIIRKGDVLVGMDGDFNVAIWKGPDGLLNQRVLKVEDTYKMKAQYMYYALPRLLKCINDVTYSTTVKHLSTFDIYDAYLPVPSIEEQDVIVAYLNEKCAEIDKAITTQQKRIDLLKELKQKIIADAITKGINPQVNMKASGIFWIGQTPQHWEVKRVKFTGEARNGLTYSPNDVCSEEDGMLVLRSSNIQEGELSFEDNVYVSKIDDRLIVKLGDTIICSRNGSLSLVGKSAFVENTINATFGAFMLRYRSYENAKYAYYMVSTAIMQYKSLFSTTTVNQLTLEIFKDMIVSVPPKEEQEAILKYLDRELPPIDAKIETSEQELNLLKEYKQSLITEVITGKRKVI